MLDRPVIPAVPEAPAPGEAASSRPPGRAAAVGGIPALGVTDGALRLCLGEVEVAGGTLRLRHRGEGDVHLGWEIVIPPGGPGERPRFRHWGQRGLWRQPARGPVAAVVIHPGPLPGLRALSLALGRGTHDPRVLHAAPGGVWTDGASLALIELLRRHRPQRVELDAALGSSGAGARSAALAREAIAMMAPNLPVVGP